MDVEGHPHIYIFRGEAHMHRLSSVVLLCALAFPAAAAAQNAAAVEHGKKVYAAEKCSICHSIGGVGNKKGSLDAVGSKLTADEIREWIVSAPEMTKKTKAE